MVYFLDRHHPGINKTFSCTEQYMLLTVTETEGEEAKMVEEDGEVELQLARMCNTDRVDEDRTE